MLEKTKELFDSPWELFSDPDEEVFQIENKSGNFIAECMKFADAAKIVLIPELYDALREAAFEHCYYCVRLDKDNETGYVPPSDDFVKKGCPKNSNSCFCRRWWDVLRKVEAAK